MYLGYDVWLVDQRIRIYRFNAFELKEEFGPRAKSDATSLLTHPDVERLFLIEVPGHKRDSFGRLLGHVQMKHKSGDLVDFSESMLRLQNGRVTDEDGQ